LSFIDDVNGVRVGSVKELDEALEAAAKKAGVRWDHDKDWTGNKGKHLGVVMLDQRRHQKYRCQKAKAAWEVVRRLSKLPVRGKRMILTQQLLPTILHREVHHHREVHQPPRYPYLGYVSMHAG